METGQLIALGSLVVALGSVGVTIGTWRLGRPRKGLGFEVLSIHPFLEFKLPDGAKRLEIRFDGQVVSDPHLVSVRVCNAGRDVISKGDFRRPIVLTFGGAKLLPATAVECVPPTLRPAPLWDNPTEVTIPPLDLNRNAEMRLTVIVSKRIADFDVECHTLVHDAVNAGDARRLGVGAPDTLRWLGKGFAVGLPLLIIGTYAVVAIRFLWRMGFFGALALLGVIFGGGICFGYLFALVLKLFDRKNWPDHMR